MSKEDKIQKDKFTWKAGDVTWLSPEETKKLEEESSKKNKDNK